MTAVNNFFVTHIDFIPNKYVRIWAQTNQEAADRVKNFLKHITPSLNNSPPQFQSIYEVPFHICCVAKFRDNNWYRVQVLNVFDNEHVWVKEIDNGSMAVVEISSLRICEDATEMAPPLSNQYYLTDIRPVTDDQKQWELVNQAFSYKIYSGSIVNKVRLNHDELNFANVFSINQDGIPVSLSVLLSDAKVAKLMMPINNPVNNEGQLTKRENIVPRYHKNALNVDLQLDKVQSKNSKEESKRGSRSQTYNVQTVRHLDNSSGDSRASFGRLNEGYDANTPTQEAFSFTGAATSRNNHKKSNQHMLQLLQNQQDSMLTLMDSNSLMPLNELENNQQFLNLMLMQNYHILQQQQMLIYWLQQQNYKSNVPECQNCQNKQLNHFSSNSLLAGAQARTGVITRHRNDDVSNIDDSNVAESMMNLTLNNQVAPGIKANNYWDNFKSNQRQNQLSTATGYFNSINKSNENIVANNQMQYSSLPSSIPNGAEARDIPEAPLAQTNPRSVRRSKKAANTSQQMLQAFLHDSGIEKVQNAEPVFKSQSQTQDLATVYSMLEKYVSNEEKKENKMVTKTKSSNITMTPEIDENEEMARNGIVNSESGSDHSLGAVSHPASRHQVPIHILPSSGAIRKRRRNPEALLPVEPSQSRGNENIEEPSLLTETVRPLMAAEGRPSETRNLPNGSSQTPNLIQGQQSQPKSHLLLKRPPITGATSRDDNDDCSNSSTDDDLAEADQTTIEMLAESETAVHNTNPLPCSNPVGISIPIIDSSNVPDESSAIVEDEEEEEEEDNISRQVGNNTGIRLSGDGEQGL